MKKLKLKWIKWNWNQLIEFEINEMKLKWNWSEQNEIEVNKMKLKWIKWN